MYRDATNNYLDFLFIDIDANDKLEISYCIEYFITEIKYFLN